MGYDISQCLILFINLYSHSTKEILLKSSLNQRNCGDFTTLMLKIPRYFFVEKTCTKNLYYVKKGFLDSFSGLCLNTYRLLQWISTIANRECKIYMRS